MIHSCLKNTFYIDNERVSDGSAEGNEMIILSYKSYCMTAAANDAVSLITC